MIKQFVFIALLALVSLTGQAQIKCHIKGKFMTDKLGDEVVICKKGTSTEAEELEPLIQKALNIK